MRNQARFVTQSLPRELLTFGRGDNIMAKTLTDIAIRNLKPSATRRELPAGNGLYVIVHPTGRKSYAVRFRLNGKPAKLTLNGGISLAAARKAAADALYEVERGHDPIEAKRASKAKAVKARSDTVQAICEEFLAREGKRLRTVNMRDATLRNLVYPEIGNQPIDSLKRSQLVRLFDTIEDNNGTRTADLALAYLRKVFNWHSLRTDDFKSPIVPGMGRYNAKEHERERVLSDDEIRAIWKATSEAAGPFPGLIQFSLLSGCRRGEVAGLRWDEIKDGVWHLPANRSKTKVDVVRPLSKAALAIVESRPRIDNGPLVFSFNGHRPMSFAKRKRELDKASGVYNWRQHDTRRTARTLLSRSGVNADIAERCLGHAIGGVRGVYDRHTFLDEMRMAFEKLSTLIESIVNPKENVAPLQRKRG
jgi:integrase